MQGSAIPPKSLSIRYYTYYIILRINTVDIMGPLLLVLTYFSNIVLQRSRCLVVDAGTRDAGPPPRRGSCPMAAAPKEEKMPAPLMPVVQPAPLMPVVQPVPPPPAVMPPDVQSAVQLNHVKQVR